MRHIQWSAIAAVAALCAFPTVGSAADMDEIIYAPEIDRTVPVEIGSGWYVRGDIGYSVETDGGGNNYFLPAPAGTRFDAGRFGTDSSVQGGIGVGYQFTDFLRGDVTAEYTKGDFSGSIPGNVTAEGDFGAGVFLANGYFDLGTVKGFTPYVGGGIGATYLDYGRFSGSAAGGPTVRTEGNADWRLTYALMAGVAVEVAENVKLDFGYRYLDAEGGRTFSSPTLGTMSDTGFAKHEIRAGIRFMLW